MARFPGADIVLVDGGSTDATAAIAARSPTVRFISSPRGRSHQMNAGARVARGDVLLFLHADTYLPDGALAAVDVATSDPGVVAGRFDVRFDNPGRAFRVIAWFMNHRSRWSGISTGDQAIFVCREPFNALGGYPDIPLMEDVELCRRLRGRGQVAALRLKVTTSARKWEQEGVVRTILLMWALRFLYMVGVRPARLYRWYYGREP